MMHAFLLCLACAALSLAAIVTLYTISAHYFGHLPVLTLIGLTAAAALIGARRP